MVALPAPRDEVDGSSGGSRRGVPLSYAELITGWMASLGSQHTRRSYQRDFTGWMSWLALSGTDLLHVRRTHVEAWSATLTGAASSRAHKLSVVSSFYAYALAQGAVEVNPLALMPRPQVSRRSSTTPGLTPYQARYLLGHAAKDSPRTHALVVLVLVAGLRISEALSARLSDVHPTSTAVVLEVSRQGGARIQVLLTADVAAALESYLGQPLIGTAVAGWDDQAGPWLFSTANGHQWSSSEAYRTIRQVARKAGIPGPITPQLLRMTHDSLAGKHGMA